MMSYDTLLNKRILVIEDDPSMADKLSLNLIDVGCNVVITKNVKDAEEAIESASVPYDIAIIDMYIPVDETHHTDRIMRGEQLAYTIRKSSPWTKIIGISIFFEREPFTPLSDLFSAFIYKNDLPHAEPPILLFETIEGILLNPDKRIPKIFLVHGRDDHSLFELKNYLQNTLLLGNPIILREKASSGKTIIEKFEKEARDVDLVFVLLTPDDEIVSSNASNIRRSRQNVIFELGFFYAKLQRTGGKVILLKKGDTELPSDISGIVYIDISNGIRASGEEIRRELKELGWIK